MELSEQGLVRVALRRSLAVIELAVAGGLLLLSYDLWTSRRVGGDGIATGFAWLFGVFCMLISLGVVLAAAVFTANAHSRFIAQPSRVN